MKQNSDSKEVEFELVVEKRKINKKCVIISKETLHAADQMIARTPKEMPPTSELLNTIIS